MKKHNRLKDLGNSISKFIRATLTSKVLVNSGVNQVTTGCSIIFEDDEYYTETKIYLIEKEENYNRKNDTKEDSVHKKVVQNGETK